ncbi:hypothetical protein [Marinobacter sp. BSs20148]|uniref:hypothetical protein n=1 Tax=Marinobacter sp. BSs20148 TaxID=490759 RepID=UPI00027772C0|nr:hypothetical protein [Marinobacter sp. BSs20148]AFP32781.1 hypothetical protein MRBBS_3845 [Marinobacter sp. BSs20148]
MTKTPKRLRTDQILIKLLHDHSKVPFSNTSIRDRYLLALSEAERPDPSQLRKHIYKELLRLESANVIERYAGTTGRGCKFIFRSEHDDVSLEGKPSPFEMESERSESSMDVETQRALKDELSNRKVELVASIGEAEEYQRLNNKYPALRSVVKTQYFESRERSTKLLGQLRAVESILISIGSPT